MDVASGEPTQLTKGGSHPREARSSRPRRPAWTVAVQCDEGGRLDRVARCVAGTARGARGSTRRGSAYEHLDQFAGRARFSTWLTRIAVHEALGRARSAAPASGGSSPPPARTASRPGPRETSGPTPSSRRRPASCGGCSSPRSTSSRDVPLGLRPARGRGARHPGGGRVPRDQRGRGAQAVHRARALRRREATIREDRCRRAPPPSLRPHAPRPGSSPGCSRGSSLRDGGARSAERPLSGHRLVRRGRRGGGSTQRQAAAPRPASSGRAAAAGLTS